MASEYRLAARVASETSRVTVGERAGVVPCVIGGREVVVIAGVGSVDAAVAVRNAGALLLRGEEFAPGSDLVEAMRAATALPVVIEVGDPRDVPAAAAVADGLEIAAAHMQDFALLSAVGETRVPVVLRRGVGATTRELLMAAEYVLMRGNERVVLCGGGVRTFHGGSGTTIDLGAVGVLRRETHLPVVVDPSEWDGDGGHVWSLAPAAVAAGADGVMVSGEGFAEVVAAMAPVALAVGRSMGGEGGRDVGIARHVRAVMGEGVVEGDSPEAVAGATRGVLEALVATHGVTADAVVSAVFTLTPDVAVAFPAAIAREMGWTGVPLLRVAAVPVPGKAKRTVGVLLHVVDA